jgi:hypothetical protein
MLSRQPTLDTIPRPIHSRVRPHPSPTLPVEGRVYPFPRCLQTHKISTSPLAGEVGRGVRCKAPNGDTAKAAELSASRNH